jgi:hypothetical protein
LNGARRSGKLLAGTHCRHRSLLAAAVLWLDQPTPSGRLDTLRAYALYLPSASQRDVDRLDTLQPDATPAQPEPFDESATRSEMNRSD